MGFLIVQNFINAGDVFIPVWKVAEIDSWRHIHTNAIDLVGIALAYFIVVIGLISYHFSILRKEHWKNWGIVRYAIDLVILVLVYYMISAADPNGSQDTPTTAYGEIFYWVLPAMFILYTAWDGVRFFEYRRHQDLDKRPDVPSKLKMALSPAFGACICFVGFFYYNDVTNATHITYWTNKTSLDLSYMIVTFILIGAYRTLKAVLFTDKTRRVPISS